MQFSTMFAGLVAAATAVNANSVTFWTLDNLKRTVYFTPSPGSAEIAPVQVDNTKNVTVDFPAVYHGNFYAVTDGVPNKSGSGMLGEFAFGTMEDITFFDVSAIVDPTDQNNIKQIWPKNALGPMSGCEVFPCGNEYVLPDDVQTKAAHTGDFWTTLGHGSTGLNLQAVL